MKVYENTAGEYGHLLIQDLAPAGHLPSLDSIEAYEALGKRCVHLSDERRSPAFRFLISSWYYEPNRAGQLGDADISELPCHIHDTDELLIYYGSDPYDPYSLGGEIEFIVGGESHVINKSTILYVPAGVPHSKPLVNRVDKPIFHLALELSR